MKSLLVVIAIGLFTFNAKAQENIHQALFEKAVELAQVWGDTILEGDYHVADKVRLDRYERMVRNDKLLFYYITYSDKAWDVSDCAFDGDPKDLKDCVSGRIVESAFVSPDFKHARVDEKNMAKFVADK